MICGHRTPPCWDQISFDFSDLDQPSRRQLSGRPGISDSRNSKSCRSCVVAGICWIQRSLRDRDAKVEGQEILREVIYEVFIAWRLIRDMDLWENLELFPFGAIRAVYRICRHTSDTP